jgi:hypothetical protein
MFDEKSFTPEQEEIIKECGSKWLRMGLSTESVDKKFMTGAVNDYYMLVLGKSRTVPVIFCKGPFEAWSCAILLYADMYGITKRHAISSSLYKNSYSSVIDRMSTGYNWRNENAIDAMYRPLFRNFEEIPRVISDNIYNKHFNIPVSTSEISKSVKDMVGIAMPVISQHFDVTFHFEALSQWIAEYMSTRFDFQFGQFKVKRCSTFEVSHKILEEDPLKSQSSFKTMKWRIQTYSQLSTVIQNLSMCCDIMPFTKFCLVIERPKTFTVNSDNRLHGTIKPAIEYNDGTAIWALNGVEVPSWIVTTKSEELSSKRILEIRNPDIRREFVSKVGIERICNEMGAQVIESGLDQKGQPCELLLLNLGDRFKRPYIKLRNATIPGIYHIEGVHPRCTNLAEAFEFRNGTTEKPEQLT